jgi:hypothetical protein
MMIIRWTYLYSALFFFLVAFLIAYFSKRALATNGPENINSHESHIFTSPPKFWFFQLLAWAIFSLGTFLSCSPDQKNIIISDTPANAGRGTAKEM